MAIAIPSSPNHNPARAITTQSTVVSVGHGDSTANAGAKKNPVPMYQDEPARSQRRTMRSHPGTGALASVFVMPSRWAAEVSAAITRQVMVPPPFVADTGWVTGVQIQSPPFGSLMKSWRRRRRLSQLDLALEADVSARHVSFIETGRSTPSRAMVLRLAAALQVPAREQNQLLLAAGLAPAYSERTLDDPGMSAVRTGVERVLNAYNPFPCLAVDRDWNVLQINAGANLLIEGVAAHLLAEPNALRISLHPDGLAPRIRNLAQWRHFVIGRLRRETALSGSEEAAALLAEIESYPGGQNETADLGGVVVPLELLGDDGQVLTFLSTVTTFGTALDLTAAELSIEAFLPADDATARALHAGN